VDNPKTESSKCENVKSLRAIVLLETTSVFNLNSLSRIHDGPLQCLQMNWYGPVVRCVGTYIHLWQPSVGRPSTTFYQSIMSFQDIEAGQAVRSPSSSVPQSREDADFRNLQHSLSLQQFKMNANVQGILKLVDQLGTLKDSADLRKTLCVLLVATSF